MMQEDVLQKGYDPHLMRRCLVILRPHLRWVTLAFLCVIGAAALDLSAPLLIRTAVDGPITHRDVDGLMRFGLLYLGLVVALGICEFFEQITMARLGQNALFDLRLRLFAHLQRLPLAFFDRNPVGRLVVRITNDMENLQELFTSGMIQTFNDLLHIAGVLVLMFWLSWKLTLVTLALAPVVILVVLVFRRWARASYALVRQRVAALNSNLAENINGMKTVRVFHKLESRFGRFSRLNRDLRDAQVRGALVYSFFYPTMEFLASAATALLIWYGGVSVLDRALTVGTFIAFWHAAQKMFGPVRELGEKYNILQAAMASAERIFHLLDEPAAPGATVAPPADKVERGEVVFEKVSFSYDGKTPVLQDVSLSIRSGEHIALVGLTGGGKTTIVNLLLRMYEADSGRILVDGRDVRAYDPRALRLGMGIVWQDVFLFSGTIEENLRLGSEEIPRERLEAAIDMIGARGLMERLPEGWRTPVGERGVRLSAGERQMLSLARALVHDPKILILDEATSNIDPETDRMIQGAIDRVLERRTAIVVAHRLVTVTRMDRVLVIHRGRIQEEGRHEELLGTGGVYAKLCRLQWATG